MKFNDVIGLDISKEKIDAVSKSTEEHLIFENNNKGFKVFKDWVENKLGLNLEKILVCLESTGLYSHKLVKYLDEKNCYFSVVSGLQIKRSLGISREKEDRADAKSIALFAYRRRDELKRSKAPGKTLVQLQRLYALRKKYIKTKKSFETSLIELKAAMSASEIKSIKVHYENTVKNLNECIKQVDQDILKVIKANKEYFTNYTLIQSVTGIGPVSATEIIITTENFSKFDNHRQYACYAGIAPFKHQSGSSIKGRTKISSIGNKSVKSVLFMCAGTALQRDPELKAYYENRIERGKSKMSTINIIKNKLIARVFAVVKRQQPFVNTYKFKTI